MTRLTSLGVFALAMLSAGKTHAQTVYYGGGSYGYSQTVGPMTNYYSADGSYSGTAIHSGPLTTYRGHTPAGSYSGTATTIGGATFYNGHVGTQHYHATGQRIGNTTFIRGRLEPGAYGSGYGQTFGGVGHQFGNLSTYQGYGAGSPYANYGYGYSYRGW